MQEKVLFSVPFKDFDPILIFLDGIYQKKQQTNKQTNKKTKTNRKQKNRIKYFGNTFCGCFRILQIYLIQTPPVVVSILIKYFHWEQAPLLIRAIPSQVTPLNDCHRSKELLSACKLTEKKLDFRLVFSNYHTVLSI